VVQTSNYKINNEKSSIGKTVNEIITLYGYMVTTHIVVNSCNSFRKFSDTKMPIKILYVPVYWQRERLKIQRFNIKMMNILKSYRRKQQMDTPIRTTEAIGVGLFSSCGLWSFISPLTSGS